MINENYKHYFIKLLVFLFPVLTATVKSAGGAILFIFVLVGCFKGWPAWKKIESWERKILFGFVFFCMFIGLSLVGTEDISGGISKFERYIYFVMYIPAYLLIRRFEVEAGKPLLLGAAVGSFVLLSQAIYQTVVLGNWYAWGAYHKIIFGDTSMMLAVILGLGLVSFHGRRWQQIIGVMALLAAISSSTLSVSRGAWIFFPIAIATILFLYRYKIGKKEWNLIAGIIAFVLVVGFVWSPDNLVQGVSKVGENFEIYIENQRRHTSLSIRINLWRDSIEIWKDSPVLGTGIGDFEGEIRSRIVDKSAHSVAARGHAHSIYFDALATTGIVGLAGLLFFMLLRPLRYYLFWWDRADNSSQKFYLSGGILVVIGFSVFGLTEGWLSRSSMVIQYLMYTLVFMSSFAVNKSREKK